MALPGFAAFLITVLVLALLSLIGWLLFTHLRARRLGLPPPSLNPLSSRTGGLAGWASAKVRAFKYRRGRRAGGNFEGDGRPLGSYNNTGAAAGSRGGFGALDPDEAWDARVGNEADGYAPGGYEEEREVGLHAGRYGGDEEMGTFVGGGGLDRRYEEEMERVQPRPESPGRNPFGDEAAVGGRGLSPRPEGRAKGKGVEEEGDSPSERRSMFREEM